MAGVATRPRKVRRAIDELRVRRREGSLGVASSHDRVGSYYLASQESAQAFGAECER
jgi:hypothetical protein